MPGPGWLLLWQAPYDMKEIQLIHALVAPHPQKAIIPLPLICCVYVRACVCVCLRERDEGGFEGMRHGQQKTNKNWTSLKVISINEYLNNSQAARVIGFVERWKINAT